jgi:intein-encoded DNA endonuclease-like protein
MGGKKYLMPHYWRGFFDGDGSIGKYLMRNSFYSWKISLNANLIFCEEFRKFLISSGCPSDGYLEKHAGIYKICSGEE